MIQIKQQNGRTAGFSVLMWLGQEQFEEFCFGWESTDEVLQQYNAVDDVPDADTDENSDTSLACCGLKKALSEDAFYINNEEMSSFYSSTTFTNRLITSRFSTITVLVN